jgi:hypothetical protein
MWTGGLRCRPFAEFGAQSHWGENKGVVQASFIAANIHTGNSVLRAIRQGLSRGNYSKYG